MPFSLPQQHGGANTIPSCSCKSPSNQEKAGQVCKEESLPFFFFGKIEKALQEMEVWQTSGGGKKRPKWPGPGGGGEQGGGGFFRGGGQAGVLGGPGKGGFYLTGKGKTGGKGGLETF